MAIDQNKAFKEATDYIKSKLNVKYKDQADTIGVVEHRWNMIRNGSVNVRKREVQRLIEAYPDVEFFFTEPQETDKEHIMNMVERYVVAKEERERILLDRIKHLEQEVKRLKGETK